MSLKMKIKNLISELKQCFFSPCKLYFLLPKCRIVFVYTNKPCVIMNYSLQCSVDTVNFRVIEAYPQNIQAIFFNKIMK